MGTKQFPIAEADLLVIKKTKKPSQYKVILWNDEQTTMEFVVQILGDIFHFSTKKAVEIMQKIHEQGSANCGVFPLEIAETKVWQVKNAAHQAGYPLKADIQKKI